MHGTHVYGDKLHILSVIYRGQTIIGSAHQFGPIFAKSAEISVRQHLTNISGFLTDVKF